MQTKSILQAGERTQKPDCGAWGHMNSFNGCTFHYGEGMSQLTIKPPEGCKIGLNLGKTIAVSVETLNIVKELFRQLQDGAQLIHFGALVTDDDTTTLADLVKDAIAKSQGY